MTFAQASSVALLGVVLAIAIWRRSNIGVLALAAAFVVALLQTRGHDTADVVDAMYTKFPGSVVILIAGVSLLFAHLEWSGALDWLVEFVFRAVGDRLVLLPWACFLIAAAFTTMGAFSTGPIALLVPIIARLSLRYRTSFWITELGVVIGANSAGLSPLNPTGTAVWTAAESAHLHYNRWGVWAVSMVTAAVVVLVLQVIDRVRQRSGRPPFATAQVDPEANRSTELNRPYRLCAGLSLLAFVVLVVKFDTDVGLTAIFFATLLQLAFRADEIALLRRVPWNAILLLAGLLTYLGLMQNIGTMTAIQHELTSHVHSQTLLVLLVAYLTALLCNIESSTLGVLVLIMGLVTHVFAGSDGFFWVVCAVAVPAALMVMNPIHVAGTLIIANAEEKQQSGLFRNLLTIAVGCLVVAPGVLGALAMLNV